MSRWPRPGLNWRPARNGVYYGLAGLGTLVVFMWRLGSSPAHLLASEKSAKLSSNLDALGNSLFNAPWRLTNDLMLHIRHDSILLQRFSSVIFGVICLAAFYYCMRSWLGRMVAVLASSLLLTTPLFLLASRSGTPRVMFFWPITMVASYLYWRRSKHANRSIVVLVVSLALALYTPGLIWLVLLLAIFKWRVLASFVTDLNRVMLAGAILGLLALIAPLVVNLATHGTLLKSYFLIPGHSDSVISILKNWGWSLAALFVKSKDHQELMVGQTAILSAAQIGLALFGAYALLAKLRLPLYLMLAASLLASLVAGFDHNFYFLEVAVLPLLILAGFGLRFLYLEWLHTFPRNPLPRYFAYGLMAALVAVHVFFGLRYALVAWPLA